MTIKKYSRQQAIKSSGTTSSRLSYLDKIGLVRPEKIGGKDSKKPVVLYTDKQIEEIRLINRASEFLHVEGLRLAIEKGCLSEIVDALSMLTSPKRS